MRSAPGRQSPLAPGRLVAIPEITHPAAQQAFRLQKVGRQSPGQHGPRVVLHMLGFDHANGGGHEIRALRGEVVPLAWVSGKVVELERLVWGPPDGFSALPTD